jgi:CheY-like chemotaxis protein
MSSADRARRVVVVDDSAFQCMAWKQMLEKRYGARAAVETYTDPAVAVSRFGPDVHLMLLDWEMPEMDGMQVFIAAKNAGVNPKRVIISSSHSADKLHEAFDHTECLAVIEKAEPEQQAAFMMILDSIMKR